MKAIKYIPLVLALSSLQLHSAVVLFADNFNRADNTNLNASADGKSGTLGALNWSEVAAGGDALISGTRLRFGDSAAGGGYSTAHLQHNFIDSAILDAGEFTITTNVAVVTAGSGATRNVGFSVGSSLAEVTGWSANVPASFPVDFFIGYDPTGTKEVKITANGVQTFQQSINLDAGGEISVRFSNIMNFNAASLVSYEAFINGGSVTNGTFTWSGTNENYVALFSNVSGTGGGNGGIIDNYMVTTTTTTIPEPSTALLGSLGLLALLRRRR